jgi:hypothetical protein
LDRSYSVNGSDMKQIKKKLQRAAQVTHGKEHPLYTYYYDLISDIVSRA